jgi:hypothetical protein
MTIMEFQADKIERIGEALIFFLRQTRTDRLQWHVPGLDGAKGRSALEQAAECAAVNEYVAGLLRGESPELYHVAESESRDVDTIASALDESVKKLAAAVRAMNEEDLMRGYADKRGAVQGNRLIEMPCRHMSYHAGQINFIQTLYGDKDFRVPANWR